MDSILNPHAPRGAARRMKASCAWGFFRMPFGCPVRGENGAFEFIVYYGSVSFHSNTSFCSKREIERGPSDFLPFLTVFVPSEVFQPNPPSQQISYQTQKSTRKTGFRVLFMGFVVRLRPCGRSRCGGSGPASCWRSPTRSGLPSASPQDVQ